MCGRFAQFHSRDEFLAALAPDTPCRSPDCCHCPFSIRRPERTEMPAVTAAASWVRPLLR